MTARTIMTAAAGLTLSAMLLAAPASAQSAAPNPKESTPQEMRATDALNAQAAKEASEIVRMNEENERAALRAQNAYAQQLQEHRAEAQETAEKKAEYEDALHEFAGETAAREAAQIAPTIAPQQ